MDERKSFRFGSLDRATHTSIYLLMSVADRDESCRCLDASVLDLRYIIYSLHILERNKMARKIVVVFVISHYAAIFSFAFDFAFDVWLGR